MVLMSYPQGVHDMMSCNCKTAGSKLHSKFVNIPIILTGLSDAESSSQCSWDNMGVSLGDATEATTASFVLLSTEVSLNLYAFSVVCFIRLITVTNTIESESSRPFQTPRITCLSLFATEYAFYKSRLLWGGGPVSCTGSEILNASWLILLIYSSLAKLVLGSISRMTSIMSNPGGLLLH